MQGFKLVVAGAFFSLSLSAQAVPASGDPVDSRDTEIRALGHLYGIDFDKGRWTHRQVALCPAFTTYVFGLYEREDGVPGVHTFLAVIPGGGGGAPVKDKPWQSEIVLIPYRDYPGGGAPTAVRSTTIKTFNRVWADEMHGAQTRSGITWSTIAACYTRFAGLREEPAPDKTAPQPPPFDLSAPPENVLVPLHGEDKGSLSVAFDRFGMVREVKLDAPAP